MITKAKAYVTTDGQVFADQGKAQEHELGLLLNGAPVADIPALIVKEGTRVGEILGIKRKRAKSTATPKPSSKKGSKVASLVSN